jgi:nicotinamidase-related amidase
MIGFIVIVAAAMTTANVEAADESNKEADKAVPVRPAVPGRLRVRLRSRTDEKIDGSVSYVPVVREEEWNASETAIIICDMWNGHYCLLAAQRVDAMAPRMNRIVSAARAHGVTVIHAPSGCMDVYADTPFRARMQRAPLAEPPVPLQRWCYLDRDKEAELPIVDSKSPCDDPVVGPAVRQFSKQHDASKLIGYDGVSDSGQEIYNHFVQLGIKNVVLMGVHTNMCVLGRSFGIRQMSNLGFNVALARDLTDAMYDPREYPYVSHTRGTELVIEHIEKYWCPSFVGQDLVRVIPGSNDPDPNVKRPEKPTAVAK